MNPNNNLRLNKQQMEAVAVTDGALLIIAGAGSGKTRTITCRIAAMLEEGILPSEILALTFTNKAAREMAHRVRGLTGKAAQELTLSTFHSFGAKLLRESIHHLGYKTNFSIYDTADAVSAIKEAARDLKYSRDAVDGYKLSQLFSGIKTGRLTWDRQSDQFRELYTEYQDYLKSRNAVDFDDLIILPKMILSSKPDVLKIYQKRYRYFMVDEFQDTSSNQYELIRLLAKKSGNICVVGDDDQSIYSWRGADFGNILRFEKDFPNSREIKLEQNYRSTRTILNAANSLIINNQNRKEKNLWTGSDAGSFIELHYPEDEDEEGILIAEMIKSLKIREKIRYSQVGVLVRANTQTRPLEAAFLAENIPVKVSGGTSFYQRKEVKDLTAYLKVFANPDDDVNFLRICNVPRRGIGRQTLLQIRAYGEEKNYSLYSSLAALCHAADSPFPERQKNDLIEFHSLMEELGGKMKSGKKMAKTVRELVDKTGYWPYLITEHPGNDRIARFKYSNIMSFIDQLESYEKDPDVMDPSLQGFLNRITLITRDDDADADSQDKINLMTIHSAKGLEFDIVFLPGVVEGIIPHARSLEEDSRNIEEERRLFYVAITRARKRLHICVPSRRRYLRDIMDCAPSPFLTELPEEVLQHNEGAEVVEKEEADHFFDAIKARFK